MISSTRCRISGVLHRKRQPKPNPTHPFGGRNNIRPPCLRWIATTTAAAAAATLASTSTVDAYFCNYGLPMLAFGATTTNVTTINTTGLFVRRPYSSSTTNNNNNNNNTDDTFDVIQTLAHRLQEPPPLRAHVTSSSTSSTTSSSSFEEKRLLTELAIELVRGYANLPPLRLPPEVSDCQRVKIVTFLASQCGPSNQVVEKAVKHYQNIIIDEESGIQQQHNNQISSKELILAISNLRKASTPPYEELVEFILRQNSIEGMTFLVSLREDLFQLLRYRKSRSSPTTSDDEDNGNDKQIVAARISQLQDLDSYLKSLFTTWFTPGMLEIRRITYDQTPASIIELIAKNEAVHPMRSLEDLRNRLGTGRRVFALFHPLLPGRPLVFVHVALIRPQYPDQETNDIIPSAMKHVLIDTETNTRQATTKPLLPPRVATFYSISNGVKGLAGVGLGEFLLKEATRSMKKEMPSIEAFVTLSPIPGFRKWLQVKLLQHNDESLLSKEDCNELMNCGLVTHIDPFPWEELWTNLEQIDFDRLSMVENDDANNNVLSQKQRYIVLQKVLSKLTSRYLILEKHHGKPLNGVCKFHVGNGAIVHNVNFAADLSRIGLNNSFGMMVNYIYDLDKLKENQANFEINYTVPFSTNVSTWL